MLKSGLIFIFLIAGLATCGQELLLPALPEVDSVYSEEENPDINHVISPGDLMYHDMSIFKVPDFDFNVELPERWRYSLTDLKESKIHSVSAFNNPFYFVPSPFVHSGTVFSGAAYSFNDKLMMGGYSFGAQSVFTAPLPNQSINQYDFRGSSMFLQYNVTKNFKIETRVNVIHGPGPMY